MERGEEEGAIRNFERAVKLDPRDVRPLMERGKCAGPRRSFASSLATR